MARSTSNLLTPFVPAPDVNRDRSNLQFNSTPAPGNEVGTGNNPGANGAGANTTVPHTDTRRERDNLQFNGTGTNTFAWREDTRRERDNLQFNGGSTGEGTRSETTDRTSARRIHVSDESESRPTTTVPYGYSIFDRRARPLSDETLNALTPTERRNILDLEAAGAVYVEVEGVVMMSRPPGPSGPVASAETLEAERGRLNSWDEGLDRNLLMVFAWDGEIDKLKKRLESKHLNLDAADYEGRTALMYGERHPEALKALLKAGANPNLRDDKGRTAAHHAAIWEDSLKVLLDGGADASLLDGEGQTVVHVAARSVESLKVLHQAGVTLDAVNTRTGETPLRAAVRQWAMKSVGFLASQKAGLNVPDSNGAFPLTTWSLEMMQMLLDAGADVNAQDAQGNPVLLSFAKGVEGDREADWLGLDNEAEWLAAAKHLLDAGASPNVRNKQGRTPLVELLSRPEVPSTTFLKLLLEAGADVTLADDSGRTALDYAEHRVKLGLKPARAALELLRGKS